MITNPVHSPLDRSRAYETAMRSLRTYRTSRLLHSHAEHDYADAARIYAAGLRMRAEGKL